MGRHILQPLPGETSPACCVAITTSLTHRDRVRAGLSQDCQSLGSVVIFQDFNWSEVVKGQFSDFLDRIGADASLPLNVLIIHVCVSQTHKSVIPQNTQVCNLKWKVT